MVQVIQLVGAILILIAFAGGQAGRMSAHSLAYILLNVFGAAVLAVTAVITENWGFVLLEGVWTVVSVWSLVRYPRGQARAGTPGPTS